MEHRCDTWRDRRGGGAATSLQRNNYAAAQAQPAGAPDFMPPPMWAHAYAASGLPTTAGSVAPRSHVGRVCAHFVEEAMRFNQLAAKDTELRAKDVQLCDKAAELQALTRAHDQLEAELLAEKLNTEYLENELDRKDDRLAVLEQALQQADAERDTAIKKLREIYKEHTLKVKVRSAKATLSQMGGKCATLAESGADICTIACAAMAKHTKLVRLLQKESAGRARTEAAHAAVVKALNEDKAALQLKASEQGRDLRRSQLELAERRVALEQKTAEAAANCSARMYAEKSLEVAEKTMRVLKAQLQRSKNISRQLFADRATAEAAKDVARQQRDDALAQRDDALNPPCVICFEANDIRYVNVPCGHSYACAVCASVTRTCAVCRCVVTDTMPLFSLALT